MLTGCSVSVVWENAHTIWEISLRKGDTGLGMFRNLRENNPKESSNRVSRRLKSLFKGSGGFVRSHIPGINRIPSIPSMEPDTYPESSLVVNAQHAFTHRVDMVGDLVELVSMVG